MSRSRAYVFTINNYTPEEEKEVQSIDCEFLVYGRETGEIKGGTVRLQHDKFIVTSNYHPMDLWEDDRQLLAAIERRFKIIKIEN